MFGSFVSTGSVASLFAQFSWLLLENYATNMKCLRLPFSQLVRSSVLFSPIEILVFIVGSLQLDQCSHVGRLESFSPLVDALVVVSDGKS